MFPLTTDCYLKKPGAHESEYMGKVHFHMSDADHRCMEDAEEALQNSGEDAMLLPISAEDMELQLPPGVGNLSDCQVRVYINRHVDRGFFYILGHRKSDGSAFFSNAMMIDFVTS